MPVRPSDPAPEAEGGAEPEPSTPARPPTRAQGQAKSSKVCRGRRPKLLSSAVRQRLLAAVEHGCTFETAAAAAGIGKSTLFDWFRRGRSEPEGGLHAQLLAEVEAARDVGTAKLAQIIFEAAPVDWRAGAHLLACRDPERWSPRRVAEAREPERVAAGPSPSSLPLLEQLRLLETAAERVREELEDAGELPAQGEALPALLPPPQTPRWPGD